YATVGALDPAKLPAVRAQVWELISAAQLHHDLHVDAAPAAGEFDSFVLHVDGYLCEIKDALIRDGLHVLGSAPAGEQRAATVQAVLRATQVWGGRSALPGLRAALASHFGLNERALLADPGQLADVRGDLPGLAGLRGRPPWNPPMASGQCWPGGATPRSPPPVPASPAPPSPGRGLAGPGVTGADL